MKNKLAIIICYYGNFPWYFPYFLHSCKFNTTIDFFIFSDIPYKGKLPGNVTIIRKTINEIKISAIEKLGFPVNIDFPYKLCDFKPAYGLLFPEFIEGYDFWGVSDIDVIYGDIRNFMDNNILNEFDYISVRHDYTTGCFALFKNNFFMNNLFKKSKDYVRVLSSSNFFSFAECNFMWKHLEEGRSILEIDTEIESFTHVVKSAENNNEIKAHFDFILVEGIPGRIKFDNGKIVYKNTFEGILYHLFQLKRVYKPEYVPGNIPDKYFISPTRIYW